MFKVWVIADNSGKWCTNAMEYKTYDEAMIAAKNLASRWFAITLTQIMDVEEE